MFLVDCLEFHKVGNLMVQRQDVNAEAPANLYLGIQDWHHGLRLLRQLMELDLFPEDVLPYCQGRGAHLALGHNLCRSETLWRTSFDGNVLCYSLCVIVIVIIEQNNSVRFRGVVGRWMSLRWKRKRRRRQAWARRRGYGIWGGFVGRFSLFVLVYGNLFDCFWLWTSL